MKKCFAVFLVIAASIIENNADAMNVDSDSIAILPREQLENSMMSPICDGVRGILLYDLQEIRLGEYEDTLNNLTVQKEALLDKTRCSLHQLMGHNLAMRFDDFPNEIARNQAIEDLNRQILDIAKNAEQEFNFNGGIQRYDELTLRLILGQLSSKRIEELSRLNALYHIRNSAIFVGSQLGMGKYWNIDTFDIDVTSILGLFPQYGIQAPENAEEIVKQYINKANPKLFLNFIKSSLLILPSFIFEFFNL